MKVDCGAQRLESGSVQFEKRLPSVLVAGPQMNWSLNSSGFLSGRGSWNSALRDFIENRYSSRNRGAVVSCYAFGESACYR